MLRCKLKDHIFDSVYDILIVRKQHDVFLLLVNLRKIFSQIFFLISSIMSILCDLRMEIIIVLTSEKPSM